ncbi:protein of unknown function [Pseudomonas sp. JV551A1]|nr:protein of unknown function [Pseudomonas sp. JV551A1]
MQYLWERVYPRKGQHRFALSILLPAIRLSNPVQLLPLARIETQVSPVRVKEVHHGATHHVAVFLHDPGPARLRRQRSPGAAAHPAGRPATLPGHLVRTRAAADVLPAQLRAVRGVLWPAR